MADPPRDGLRDGKLSAADAALPLKRRGPIELGEYPSRLWQKACDRTDQMIDETDGTGTPDTPPTKRLKDNRSQHVAIPDPIGPPTSTRNPTQGIYEDRNALPYAATAGSCGFFVREEQDRQSGGHETAPSPTQRPDARTYKLDMALIKQQCKLIIFRDMSVTFDDIQQLYQDQRSEMTTDEWRAVATKIPNWVRDWQRKMWGTAWFVQFVRTHVATYNNSVLPVPTQSESWKEHATAYDYLTAQQRRDVWLSGDLLTLDIITTILNPLGTAIDISGVWTTPAWRQYILTIAAAACDATWTYMCRVVNSITVRGNDANGSQACMKEVYQHIRAAPENLCPNRPALTDVPVRYAGPLDKGRRTIRQTGPTLMDGG